MTDGELSDISAVVLAGGRGERLGGQDKATTTLAGVTLLERVIRRVADLAGETIVVLRPDQEITPQLAGASLGARIVRDVPGAGVLAAMAAGLSVMTGDCALLVACDMPFLQLPLLRYLLTLRSGWDIVVPRLEVGLEPLHALYHRRCLAPLGEALAQGSRRAVSFYATLHVRYVDADEIALYDPRGISFFNVNTPDDLAQAEAWARQEA